MAKHAPTVIQGEQDSTPLGQALERLESILESASRQAKSFRLTSLVRQDRSLASALIAKEPVLRDAISENCREWIEAGNVPPMPEDVAYLFFLRLHYGENLIRWLRSDGVLYQKTPNEALVWLLIDSWDYIARAMWIDDLRDD